MPKDIWAAFIGIYVEVFDRIALDLGATLRLSALIGFVPILLTRFEPFSDFLLHDMGSLGDGIEQGRAGQWQMRTAPLWGLRVRTTFLHDGRVSSLDAAILAHDGQGRGASAEFAQLDTGSKNALMAFLRSL